VKICSYCGRANEENAWHCFECGTDDFKTNAPRSSTTRNESDSPKLEVFEPRALSTEEQQQAFVTLQKCRSVDEANMLAAQLKLQGVDAFLPDENVMSNLAATATGFVRLNVPTQQYKQAVDILVEKKRLADEAMEPESVWAKNNSTLPLSWGMRFLMFMLPCLCATLLIAAYVCTKYRKNGFVRRAEEAYLCLLLGMAFWGVFAFLMIPSRR
jgi:hypothetical protein